MRVYGLVKRSVYDGETSASRPCLSNERSPSARSLTRRRAQHRTVRLLAPLAADLRLWRMAAGRPGDSELVFPGNEGQPWTQAAYQSWRRRAFNRVT
jgi:hypothetical protein